MPIELLCSSFYSMVLVAGNPPTRRPCYHKMYISTLVPKNYKW